MITKMTMKMIMKTIEITMVINKKKRKVVKDGKSKYNSGRI